MSAILIADSGATKCEWSLVDGGKKKTICTQGISPYFLTAAQIEQLLAKELLPKLRNATIQNIFFYGTGLSNADNATIIKKVLKKLFPAAKT